MNRELPDVQAGFRKDRGTRDQIGNIRWIMEKEKEFQKNIYFCFIDYAKAFDCVDHNKLWKILKEMGIPDHLTCLLRNLYAGPEATVRTGHGTTDWFQIGNGVPQGCIFSPKISKQKFSLPCRLSPSLEVTFCFHHLTEKSLTELAKGNGHFTVTVLLNLGCDATFSLLLVEFSLYSLKSPWL